MEITLESQCEDMLLKINHLEYIHASQLATLNYAVLQQGVATSATHATARPAHIGRVGVALETG